MLFVATSNAFVVLAFFVSVWPHMQCAIIITSTTGEPHLIIFKSKFDSSGTQKKNADTH